MKRVTRRDFLKMGGLLAAGTSMAGLEPAIFAQGLERLHRGTPKVVWIQGQSCSGCSVSLLNADSPYILEIVTDILSLVFHQTLGAAQGNTAIKVLEDVLEDDYILAVEGSIPTTMPEACMMAGRPFADQLLQLARRAQYVVAIGTCATYGGMPAAEGNETGAEGVKTFFEANGIRTRGFLVNCPSCPTHPNSIVGTFAYLAGRGYPEVDPELLTPRMYYSYSTHDDCPRYHYYVKHIFTHRFGEQVGCLFKIGCLGMLSYTECPRRQWNGGINWCIRASAPCVGCSHPAFGKRKAFPFYRFGEEVHPVAYQENERKGAYV